MSSALEGDYGPIAPTPVAVPFTAASASGSASLAFAEDTDNGAHAITVKAPASVAANADVELPGTAGTLALQTAKRYTAVLTQTGTNAPVATVIENTLGGTLVWTYSAPGVYIGTLAAAFTNATFCIMANLNWDGATDNFLTKTDVNSVTIAIAGGNDMLTSGNPANVHLIVAL